MARSPRMGLAAFSSCWVDAQPLISRFLREPYCPYNCVLSATHVEIELRRFVRSDKLYLYPRSALLQNFRSARNNCCAAAEFLWSWKWNISLLTSCFHTVLNFKKRISTMAKIGSLPESWDFRYFAVDEVYRWLKCQITNLHRGVWKFTIVFYFFREQ